MTLCWRGKDDERVGISAQTGGVTNIYAIVTNHDNMLEYTVSSVFVSIFYWSHVHLYVRGVKEMVHA